MRAVNIGAVMNGFIVTVGCQTLVFTTREELLRELNAYLENPEQTEKRYWERYPASRLTQVTEAVRGNFPDAVPQAGTPLGYSGESAGCSVAPSRF